MAEVDVGRGRVDPELDPQRPALRARRPELRRERTLGQTVDALRREHARRRRAARRWRFGAFAMRANARLSAPPVGLAPAPSDVASGPRGIASPRAPMREAPPAAAAERGLHPRPRRAQAAAEAGCGFLRSCSPCCCSAWSRSSSACSWRRVRPAVADETRSTRTSRARNWSTTSATRSACSASRTG